MTGAEFKKGAVYLFGQTQWRTETAAWLGIHRSTVWRYAEGDSIVPAAIGAAMESRVTLERERAARARAAAPRSKRRVAS